MLPISRHVSRTTVRNVCARSIFFQWGFAGCKARGRFVSTGGLSRLENVSRSDGHSTQHDRGIHTPRQRGSPASIVDHPRKRHPMLMGVATTNNPSATTIEELVQKLEGNTYGKWLDFSSSTLDITLLLTPTYAQSSLSSELPLDILTRLGNGLIPLTSANVITAVVDRLPSVRSAPGGVEGLAYLIQTGENLVNDPPKLLQPSVHKPGSLSFGVKLPQSSEPFTTIQLPLAQTIFSTGLPSTLIRSQYCTSDVDGKLYQTATDQLESYTVQILMEAGVASRRQYIPLIPLTPARKVEYAMGNIVRKLSTELTKDERPKVDARTSNPETSMPASQELESSISEYFQKLDIQPEPVQVWALILPPYHALRARNRIGSALLNLDHQTIRSTWSSEPDRTILDRRITFSDMLNVGLPHLLRKGARLSRVLSGGGGWGKKAGLLSLDPDTSYSTRDLRHDQGWEFSFDEDDSREAVERQQKEALGQIVQEGESVMFFLAPRRSKQQPEHIITSKPLVMDNRFPEGGDRGLTFGPLPSSIDEPSQSTSQFNSTQSDQQTRVEHHERVFGMLSEGGMAIEAFPPPPRSNQNSWRAIDQTKVDVPFARYSMEVKPAEEILEAMDDDGYQPHEKPSNTLKSSKALAGLSGSHAEGIFLGTSSPHYVPDDFQIPLHLVEKHSQKLAKMRTVLTSPQTTSGQKSRNQAVHDKLLHERADILREIAWSTMSATAKRRAWISLNHTFLHQLKQGLSPVLGPNSQKIAQARITPLVREVYIEAREITQGKTAEASQHVTKKDPSTHKISKINPRSSSHPGHPSGSHGIVREEIAMKDLWMMTMRKHKDAESSNALKSSRRKANELEAVKMVKGYMSTMQP